MYFAPVYDVREIKVVVLPTLFVTSYMVRVSTEFNSHVSGQFRCTKVCWTDFKPTLIIPVANVTTLVAYVRSAIDKTLRIMHVPIASSTAGSSRVSGVSHVYKDEPSPARQVVSVPHGLIAANRPSSDGITELLIHHDVVRPPDGQLVEMSSEVLLCENGRAVRVEVEKLLHVEDLHAVLDSLGADDNQVAEGSDLSPPRADRVVLGQPAEVHQLTLGDDLGEGCSVVLAYGNKLSSILGRPTPRGGPKALGASKVCMGKEVVQVDLRRVRGKFVAYLYSPKSLEILTLLHWKVLFASPGIAVARPSTQGV